MTATLTRPDPFTDAMCRRRDAEAQWWDDDADLEHQELAKRLCTACPALTACQDLVTTLGEAVSGTLAGAFYRWDVNNSRPDDDALAEYTAIFGPSAAVSDLPPPCVVDAKPVRYGRYWVHPSQLSFEWDNQEAM